MKHTLPVIKLGLMVILFVTLQSGGCKKDDTPVNPIIGTSGPAGGIVFYDKGFYSEGWRYMEILPYELPETGAYGCRATRYNNCYSGAIGVGLENTQNMLLAEDTLPDCGIRSAARMCADFSVNGYDDWFLPSSGEMVEAVERLYYPDNIGHFGGIFVQYRTSTDNYMATWTGSEAVYGLTAYTVEAYHYDNDHNSSQSTAFYKDAHFRVRPVRRY